MSQIVVNAPNRWRLDTPGASQWPRSAHPDAANKYFMVSADGHANEPANLWVERIDAKYRERLPRVVTDKEFRSAAQDHLAHEIFRRVRERQAAE